MAQQILDSAERGFAAQEQELAQIRARQPLAVTTVTATGSTDIDESVSLDRRFRLVFIRCHFSGNPGTAPMTIAVASGQAAAYDAHLFTITRAGANHDVNFRIPLDQSGEPSPWTFQTGDGVRIQWTNPDSGNITWGLEVGLAVAS